MPQELINLGIGIIAAGGGWWLKTVWDSHRALETKVAAIEVLVVGQYVKRDELAGLLAGIDRKLDAIFLKLDGKADKP